MGTSQRQCIGRQMRQRRRRAGGSNIWRLRLILLQFGIIGSATLVNTNAQPATTPGAPNKRPRLSNRRRRMSTGATADTRRNQDGSNLHQLERSLSSETSLSYLTFTPSDDASIFQSRPNEANSDRSNGPWLYFQGGVEAAASDPEATQGSAKIESLLLFNLSFINHKNPRDLSSATLKLCKSVSDEGQQGGPFEPEGVIIHYTPIKRPGGTEWKESLVSWDSAPESLKANGAKATFINSHTDEHCRWDVYDVTDILWLSLDSSQSYLSMRLGSKYEHVAVYASKDYEWGGFSPEMVVYFKVDSKGSEEDTDQNGNNPVVSTASATTDSNQNNFITQQSIPEGSGIKLGCAYQLERVGDYIQGTPYKEGDIVNNNGKVYECKGYPFSGWCSTYEPGNDSVKWNDAWSDLGECVQMIYSIGDDVRSSKIQQSSNLVIGDGCTIHPFDPTKAYQALEEVSYAQTVYRCKPAPASIWCNMASYEPGYGTNWELAWIKLDVIAGPCIEGSSSSSALSILEDGSPNDENNGEVVAQVRPTSGEKCVPLFDRKHTYSVGDQVFSDGYNYSCLIPVWCNEYAYAPIGDNVHSTVAWKRSDEPCYGKPGTHAPTPRPTQQPTVAQPCNIRTNSNCCAPLFTYGVNYAQFERISFEGFNYVCHVPEKCRDVMYVPRSGADSVGIAWWKDVEPCQGVATRLPTPSPTPLPTTLEPTIFVETAESKAHDVYYINSVPKQISTVLNRVRRDIEKRVLVRRTSNMEWEESTLYDFDGLLKALGVVTMHPTSQGPFYLPSSSEGRWYGLTNLAAFLAQAMTESIKYDICDESNVDFVNNKFPLSNACGQGGASYQDMKCSEQERQYECPVKKDMTIKAVTNNKWLGGASGAPAPLFCTPKSELPNSGFWDHLYKCDRPFRGEVCDAYEGHTLGRIDNSVAAGNQLARTDVEGCCWWGRGVIAAKGVCSIGKMNYFFGKGGTEGGRGSPYGDVDMCEDPEQICSSTKHKELKWVAGMFSWTETVQSYNKDGWSYVPELNKFVENGWKEDDPFIDQVSKVLNKGCHDEEVGCEDAEGSWERRNNFYKVLAILVFRPLQEAREEAKETMTPTSKPIERLRPTVLRTKRPTIDPASVQVPERQQRPPQILAHTEPAIKRPRPTGPNMPTSTTQQQSTPSIKLAQTKPTIMKPSGKPTRAPRTRPPAQTVISQAHAFAQIVPETQRSTRRPTPVVGRKNKRIGFSAMQLGKRRKRNARRRKRNNSQT